MNILASRINKTLSLVFVILLLGVVGYMSILTAGLLRDNRLDADTAQQHTELLTERAHTSDSISLLFMLQAQNLLWRGTIMQKPHPLP